MTVPSGGAEKDRAHINKEWVIDRQLIDGVKTREVRNVVTANGITTEVYGPDWNIVDGRVQQAIHVSLRGGTVSAWHQHRDRWDFIMVVGGHMRVVLYDPREGSPTHSADRHLPPEPVAADAARGAPVGMARRPRTSRTILHLS